MDDPNIIYGGDFENFTVKDANSLGEVIINSFRKGGDKIGIINGLTGESWSFNKLLEQSIKIAVALHNAGVKGGDRISIVADNRHEYVVVACGVFLLNATLAPLNHTYTERELRHAFELIKPQIVFTVSSCFGTVEAVCKQSKHVKHIITIDNSEMPCEGTITMRKFLEKFSRLPFDVESFVKQKVNKEEQIAMIFQSSGTTGTPKGVLITQMNFLACMQISHENQKHLTVDGSTVIPLGIAPWSHVMGFMGSLYPILSTEPIYVFLPKFEGDLYLRTIEKYKVTVIAVPPPLVVFLTKTPLFDKYDLSSLKIIFCGAAPLSSDVELAVKKRFKQKISVCQGYGMSESTLSLVGTFVELEARGTVGKVLSGVYAKVIDKDGNSLGSNKVGELCFKGPSIMKGYLDNPKATAETIDKDGWLHTGDLGYYDDQKQFFIVDRLKELIKYKGFQVPPAEIEGLLLSHPKIKDAGVIGIPNQDSGELPFAYVVKQDGAELTEKEVKEFVTKNASNPKWLRGGVGFTDEIPKNPSGKILRRELKNLYTSSRSKL